MSETETLPSQRPLTQVTKRLAPAVIQRNILDQLNASRDILTLVPRLAEIIRELPEDDENKKAKSDLQDMMNTLLDIGRKLSRKATGFGEQIFGSLESQ